MHCAKCQGQIETMDVDGVEVDRCDQCGGFWFDAKELDHVLKHGKAALLAHGDGTGFTPGAEDRATAICPRCLTPLVRVDSLAVEGLHYDECAGCGGVWLDRGELEAIHSDDSAAAIVGFFTSEPDSA
ncbi:MAG: zf-TFIIB domain-containing protein [Deltaproteobacteria bacterium]|nr:zf-TFIIB domain-containing protein [Deltaproteobacteria bacterium]